MISSVIKVPIKVTAKALCRRDGNLFTADVVITFMLKKSKMLITLSVKICNQLLFFKSKKEEQI